MTDWGGVFVLFKWKAKIVEKSGNNYGESRMLIHVESPVGIGRGPVQSEKTAGSVYTGY